MPLEGRRWIVSVAGRFDDKPPGDPGGFMDFVRSLRTPTIAHALRSAKLGRTIYRFGTRTCVRRDFSTIPGLPRGLVVLGDAICRFNPMYGQGMSVAALQAQLLQRMLDSVADGSRPLAGVESDFFTAAQTMHEAPWSMTTALDFAYPRTQGHRPKGLDERRQFALALSKLSIADPAIHRLTLEVQHLRKPLSVYRDPALVERVRAFIANTHAAKEGQTRSSAIA